jgi:metacaspase-1
MRRVTRFEQGYALVIGIATYQSFGQLSTAVCNDADDLASVLADSRSAAYPVSHIKLLLDKDATWQAIRAGFNWLAEAASEDATVLVYFTGHACQVQTSEGVQSYILAVNSTMDDLEGSALSSDALTILLSAIRSQRLLMILDACKSGGIGDVKSTPSIHSTVRNGIPETTIDRLSEGIGRVILSSCRPEEYSIIEQGSRNSAFTGYLLEALQGAACSDGLVRIFAMAQYISKQMAARKLPQHPILKAHLENDFPIALCPIVVNQEPTPSILPGPTGFEHRTTEALLRSFKKYRYTHPDEILKLKEELRRRNIDPGTLT